MKQTKKSFNILPLDMKSISSLLQTTKDTFQPLSYTLIQNNPDISEIHVDIEGCDSDSICIDLDKSSIEISAKLNWIFNDEIGDKTLSLFRQIKIEIPLPMGLNTSLIHSKINDEQLIIYIPVSIISNSY